MKTEFHVLVKKHKAHSFDMRRVVFLDEEAAELFVAEYAKCGYTKPLKIHRKNKFWFVTRVTPSK